MTGRSDDAGRSIVRTIAKIALVAVAGALVLWATVGRLAAWKRASVEAAWAESYGDWDDFLARHPSRDANDPARLVERRAAALGVSLAPRTSGATRPAPARDDARREFEEIRKPLFDWVGAELSRAGISVSAAPAEGSDFLARRAPELAALRAALGEGVPRWSLHLHRGFNTEIPNLLGHMTLQRLLAADALDRLAGGDRAGALDDLEASWTLNAGLRDDPVVITQLVAIAITRLQLGILRRVPDAPAEWLARLDEHDFGASLEEALRVEGVLWTRPPHVVDPEILTAADGTDRRGSWPFERAIAIVLTPYERFSAYDHAGLWLRDMQRLERWQPTCGLAGEPFRFLERPRWNLIARIAMPNLANAIDRGTRLQLEMEVTRRWLDLHAARAASGAWPDALPGEPGSTVCPGARFVYRLHGASPRLALDVEPSWPNQAGLILPNRVEGDGDARSGT